MSKREQREAEIVSAIVNLVKAEENATVSDRERWRSSFAMFTYGSQFPEKEDWQTQFSINKYERKVRASQAEFKNIILNNPDWYMLEATNPANPDAERLATLLKRYMDYHLRAANFIRFASTFFLDSLLRMGVMYVGWKNVLVHNPSYILNKTKKAREKEQQGLASIVQNPHVDTAPNVDDIIADFEAGMDGIMEAKDLDEVKEPEEREFVQFGTIDFQIIQPELSTWDSSVSYMEDSSIVAWRTKMKLHEVKELGKRRMFKNTKQISEKPPTEWSRLNDIRIKSRNFATPDPAKDEVELLIYFGPLVLDGQIKKYRYHCIIANESVMLKEGDYPFWEPPGHKHPVVMAAVKEIPGRPTGAGMGDMAVKLQRVLDSNWQLMNDQMRFGVLGLNIFKYSSLIDRSQLERGVAPGMHIEVRDNPRDAFQRIEYTSNIENQVKPVQLALESGINDNAGVEETFSGGSQTRSRTTAAEVQARMNASDRTINSAAMDLEQQFLIPVLNKVLARILQFGFMELTSNPELKNIFTDEEIQYLQQIGQDKRAELLNSFFKVRIKGFTDTANKGEMIKRVNEAMTIVNSGGPIAAMLPVESIVRQWIRLLGLTDLDINIVPDTDYAIATAENQVLRSGHLIEPSPSDNDEVHMGIHSQVQQPTEQLQQHIGMHQQAAMQKQQSQQMAQEGQQGQQGQGVAPQQGNFMGQLPQ